MALKGIHVAFGVFGDHRRSAGGLPLRAETTSSETMAKPGVSTAEAPSINVVAESPVVAISAAADLFFAVGANPDAERDPRDYLKAGETVTRFCRHGDRIAWIEA